MFVSAIVFRLYACLNILHTVKFSKLLLASVSGHDFAGIFTESVRDGGLSQPGSIEYACEKNATDSVKLDPIR
jgi:hypothetical protein